VGDEPLPASPCSKAARRLIRMDTAAPSNDGRCGSRMDWVAGIPAT